MINNRALLFEYFKRIKERSRKCYNPSCNNDAIYSHLLQQNGVLNHIAEKGMAVVLSDKLFIDEQFKFEQVSLSANYTLKFKGFCNYCDTKLFAPIENGNVNFANYRNQLLFAYRGLLKTLDDKQVMHKFLWESLETGKLSEDQAEYHRQRLLSGRIIIKDKLYYKRLFEKELFDGSINRNFAFHVVELPLVQVATAVAALPLISGWINTADPFDIEMPGTKHRPRTDIAFINLVPTKDKLILVLGSSKVRDNGMLNFYQSKACLKGDAMFSFISHFLVRSTNTWAISPALYKRLVTRGKDKLAIHNKRESYSEYRSLDKPFSVPNFNMFEGEY